jgi:hypothetical protein
MILSFMRELGRFEFMIYDCIILHHKDALFACGSMVLSIILCAVFRAARGKLHTTKM